MLRLARMMPAPASPKPTRRSDVIFSRVRSRSLISYSPVWHSGKIEVVMMVLMMVMMMIVMMVMMIMMKMIVTMMMVMMVMKVT